MEMDLLKGSAQIMIQNWKL